MGLVNLVQSNKNKLGGGMHYGKWTENKSKTSSVYILMLLLPDSEACLYVVPRTSYQVWLQMNIFAVAQHHPHVLLSNIAGTNKFCAKTAVLKGNQVNNFQSIHHSFQVFSTKTLISGGGGDRK